MKRIYRFLDAIFPFAITLVLWRLSFPIINPCGVLAIVPIFYYSFISDRREFLPMAVLGCFLIDYGFGTMLLWTTAFCAAYAANHLQTAFRFAVTARHGLYSFAGFTALCLLILGAWSFFETGGVNALAQAVWIWALTVGGYLGWIKIMRNE